MPYDSSLVNKTLLLITEMCKKMEEFKILYESSTGEVKNAYSLVLHDIHWKTQQLCWKLAYSMGEDDVWNNILNDALMSNSKA